jgi:hypothetical protein
VFGVRSNLRKLLVGWRGGLMMMDDGGVDDVGGGGTGERRNYAGKLSKSWGRSKRGALVCSLIYLQYDWSFLLQVVDISQVTTLSVTYDRRPRKIALSRISPVLAYQIIKNYISYFQVRITVNMIQLFF